MGRRSIIPMTTINRLISQSNRRVREKERGNLIRSQSGGAKETPPELSLQSVDFNSETRITKLEFLQTQHYRTITKYVTQNYVKYPIYSDWKTKSKKIKKTIKLTNEELESLLSNEDIDIRRFAYEIVLKINNPDLLPSWFLKQVALEAYREKTEMLRNEFTNLQTQSEEKIKNLSNLIKTNQNDIKFVNQSLNEYTNQYNLTKNKIDKIENADKNLLKILFTFFIYCYLISDKRKNKLIVKNENTKNVIISLKDSINQKESDNKNYQIEIQNLQEDLANNKLNLDKQINHEYNELNKQQKQITPLPTVINVDAKFMPLKTFTGLTYSKIVGCYIIHNTYNDKYYIGQSKDIIKRIRQHFRGTVPNNIIFAEDYYSVSTEIRDTLFEIKIIPCATKDELDTTEKQLIEEYNAFKFGYNGTSGNN